MPLPWSTIIQPEKYNIYSMVYGLNCITATCVFDSCICFILVICLMSLQLTLVCGPTPRDTSFVPRHGRIELRLGTKHDVIGFCLGVPPLVRYSS